MFLRLMEGEEKGRIAKAREIAKSLKAAKANPQLISEVTGLSIAEVEAL